MPKGGVVLIPFVGTGAECAAAKELNQNYIGFEINPDYVKIAEKTITSVKVHQNYFDLESISFFFGSKVA